MKKILIVDDSAFMRNILKDLLLSKHEEATLTDSVEFVEADGKQKALIQLKKYKPNIILLDIVMKESEKEGIEFLHEIKKIFNIGKIIIITSIGQESALKECRHLGIKHYLQKPFEPKEVIEAINQALLLD